jgi:ATP-dependent DNA helicase DinG
MGFWEGVDVPGNALRLVILEKIPFPVPSDPIIRARAIALEQNDRNAFNELMLPLAEMSLKQGFGRLIRTQTDRGVVALLDSRVHRRGYGQRLLSQLPPARRVIELEIVENFLREVNRESAP